jgi:hypothetical protein
MSPLIGEVEKEDVVLGQSLARLPVIVAGRPVRANAAQVVAAVKVSPAPADTKVILALPDAGTVSFQRAPLSARTPKRGDDTRRNTNHFKRKASSMRSISLTRSWGRK